MKKKFAGYEDSVDALTQGLEDYIKKNKERHYNDQKQHVQHKINRTPIIMKRKWDEKQLYGFFKRQTNETSQKT